MTEKTSAAEQMQSTRDMDTVISTAGVKKGWRAEGVVRFGRVAQCLEEAVQPLACARASQSRVNSRRRTAAKCYLESILNRTDC